jgi:hypothetical protein
MRQKRSARIGAYAGTWPPSTSIGQVARWSTEQFSAELIGYLHACEKRDDDAMLAAAKKMRAITTSLDQFRRMKQRQWAAEKSAIKPREEPHE